MNLMSNGWLWEGRYAVFGQNWIRLAAVVAFAFSIFVIAPSSDSKASRLAFPGQWTNPGGTTTFEDWGFGSCGSYVSGYAHLGADSQGYPAGGAVRSIAGGTVVSLSTGWPGDALGIEHRASDGSRFVATYAHITRRVSPGATVSAGEVIGSVLDQGSNSHLHFGVRPLGAGESGASAALKGRTQCGGSTYGYVNPVPWLQGKQPAGQGASGPPANGQFISYQGNVYRIAGGAPIYVSSWAHVGGQQATRELTAAEFNALRSTPADGTFVSAVGNGHGEVYRFAGGAPIYVSNWANVGGERPVVAIDHAAVDHSGEGGVWSHIRRTPVDGTIISAIGNGHGEVYRFAGGAPIYVSNWAHVGGQQSHTQVDYVAVEHSGEDGIWSHIRRTPVDGTFISAEGNGHGEVYRFAGGAPIYVSSWAHVGGPKSYTAVDYAAVDHSGESGIWSHIRRTPVDGTFISAVGSGHGEVYRVAGGAPIYVSAWSHVGGEKPVVEVDYAAVDHSGESGIWSHLRKTPADGTFLRSGPSGAFYKTTNGSPYSVSGSPSPHVVVDPVAIANAGKASPWNHLLALPVVKKPDPPVVTTPTATTNAAGTTSSTQTGSSPNQSAAMLATIRSGVVKRGKNLGITLKGLADGTKLTVQFKRSGKTNSRSATVRSGSTTAKVPTKKGTYRVVVVHNGKTIGQRKVNIK